MKTILQRLVDKIAKPTKHASQRLLEEVRNVFIVNVNKKKAFTLVEVMIVVAILGLLAAIVIPHLVTAHQKARGILSVEDRLARRYNVTDVQIYCTENNVDMNTFSKSDVLQQRYEKWLSKEKDK